MKPANWRVLAEAVGVAAIVASLVFVGLQLEQESDISLRESRSDFVDTRIEIARLLNENKDVWVKGLIGSPLTELEQWTFDMLVQVYYLDRVNRYDRRKRSVDSGNNPDELATFVALRMYQHPGLRASIAGLNTRLQILQNAAGLPYDAGEFWQKVRAALEEYDEKQPELPQSDYVFL